MHVGLSIVRDARQMRHSTTDHTFPPFDSWPLGMRLRHRKQAALSLFLVFAYSFLGGLCPMGLPRGPIGQHPLTRPLSGCLYQGTPQLVFFQNRGDEAFRAM